MARSLAIGGSMRFVLFTNNMYLSIIFGGFEVWGGGEGLQLKAFCANVE